MKIYNEHLIELDLKQEKKINYKALYEHLIKKEINFFNQKHQYLILIEEDYSSIFNSSEDDLRNIKGFENVKTACFKIININKDYSYTHYVINVFFEISDNNFELKIRGFHSLSGDDYKKDSKIETSKIVDKLFKLLKISNF
tara:strand:+ start:37604 stop:38029 length:426 start_codon:yes stop_codon:yes gene_type:complete